MFDFLKKKKKCTNTNPTGPENRQHQRFAICINASIKIMIAPDAAHKVRNEVLYVRCSAITENISIGGMLLRIVMDTDENKQHKLSEEKMQMILGRSIELFLPEKHILIWGEITRSNAENGELAIAITKVSDVPGWKKLCRELQDGISIFPDSVRVRRKRRANATP